MVIPIFILILYFSYTSLKKERKAFSKKTACYIVLLLSLIVALRPEKMPDYQNYIGLFEYEFDNKELGYLILVKISKKIFGTPLALFFIGAVLSTGLKVSVINRYSNLVWLSIAVYLSNLFILHDMIQLRCAIASGFILWAIFYRFNDRPKYAIACIFAATMFHYSSVIAFVVFILKPTRKNTIIYSIALIISYILAIFNVGFGYLWGLITFGEYANLWEVYSLKLSEDELSDINIYNAIFIFRYILCFIFLSNANKLTGYCVYALPLVKIYCVSVIIFLLLTDIPVLAFRLSELLQIVEIILLPMLCYMFKSHRLGVLFVLCICLSFFLMNVFYSKLLL